MTQRVTAIYDEQCEICQAMVTWIRLLDRRGLVDCVVIDPDRLGELHPDLELDQCLRVLHAVSGGDEAGPGEITAAWDAVIEIARVLPLARPLVWLDRWGAARGLASRFYEWIAGHRYELSKCRGGACSVARPARTRRLASMRTFWTCYNLGLLLRLPLIAGHAATTQARFFVGYLATRRREVALLDGRLRLLFLGGWPVDAVPLVFGERFCAVVYRGILVDPGSTRMRGSMRAHHRRGRLDRVSVVTVTHHHEEHSGNLDWAGQLVGAPVVLGSTIAAKLSPPTLIPRIRRFFIGQPDPLADGSTVVGRWLEADGARLEVIPAPGHCDDHVVFWGETDRVLLVGDSFMGAYFSSPNPDVDSLAWIATLERLISLRPEIMVEGHGHVHTLRTDIEDSPHVVIRRDPVDALTEKLEVMRWVRSQIETGLDEGLPVRAIEATCFPWGRRWSWENLVADETARLMTGGEFSRSELVRSFSRPDGSALPRVMKARLFRDD